MVSGGSARSALKGSYMDIESILADETKVPVTFKVTSSGLGRSLDPGADEDDVVAGTKLDLPLWMVRNLAERGFISLHTPGFYGERMRRRLRAGAAVEDLRACCPYYYAVAGQLVAAHAIASAAGADSGAGPLDDSLPAFAMQTFQTRYKELLTKGGSKSDASSDALTLAQRLSCEEDALFQAARAPAAAADRWRNSEVLAARPRQAKRKPAAAGLPSMPK